MVIEIRVSEEAKLDFNFLEDADNWLKGILGDEITIRYLFKQFLPAYDIFHFDEDYTSSGWVLKYQRVQPYRLWLHHYEGDFSKPGSDLDRAERALRALYKKEQDFLDRILGGGHSTFDYLGIHKSRKSDKCLIDVKTTRHKQIKLSKNQKEAIPTAVEKGYDILFVQVILRKDWNIQARLLRAETAG